MNSSQAFWNRRAAKYAATPVADQAAYEEKLARTRKLLDPDMTMLEFGCGTGSTALIHAPNVRSVLAIDYSEEMIGIANAKAEKAGITNITFRTDAIETLTAEDASFDIVLGMSILHLVDNRRQVIERVHALLRPGGYFVSSTACVGTMSPILRAVLPLGGKLGLIPRIGIFTDDILVHDLEAAGFIITDKWRAKPGAALFIIAQKP